MEEECSSTPEEDLEPNSTGLKSSRTGEVWHKSLEEFHSAQVKERSLFGHLLCSEKIQKKILESDIFRILEPEEVKEIGALYKVSPSKFILIFRSKTAKEKLQGAEIQYRFGDSEIKLSFCKQIEPLINGKEPIFVTINLPEYISDQAARIAFPHFGKVVSVFKGRHKCNRKSEVARDMSESSLREGIQRYCQGKLLSMVVPVDMSSLQKRWCCATGAKLVTCLARIIL